MDVTASEDPVAALRRWFDEAQTGLDSDAAMVLATVGPDGMPSARVVLCRGIEDDGSLLFYTNYRSRKGRELDAVPVAAAVLYWPRLGRQARVEGDVKRTTDGESDAYFSGRPRSSRLSAWASPQSEPIDEPTLARRVAEAEQEHAGGEVPRPPWWGGYRLWPRAIELWTHGDHRLHHRLRFERIEAGTWRAQRLAP